MITYCLDTFSSSYPSDAVAPGAAQGGTRGRQARARAGGIRGSRGSRGNCRRFRKCKLECQRGLATQREDPSELHNELGNKLVKQRAGEGDREAQWSLGYWLMSDAEGVAEMPLGTAGGSPMADVGLAPRTAQCEMMGRRGLK